VKITSLSHRARAALRAFLALWIEPAPRPAIGLHPDLAEAIAAEREAKARRQTQLIHQARQRAFAARNEGLRREVEARQPKGIRT